MYIFKLCKAKRDGLISPDKQGTTCISSSYARQNGLISPDKQGTLNMYIFKLCKAKRDGQP